MRLHEPENDPPFVAMRKRAARICIAGSGRVDADLTTVALARNPPHCQPLAPVCPIAGDVGATAPLAASD
ncbi:MAG: hypothetical protein EA420_01270 [Candidatus Competibacteraceae bacterium]|nr:MAG: hypothetical protein EA420_01270 [Candidatus Competibacteraceae bacterium]